MECISLQRPIEAHPIDPEFPTMTSLLDADSNSLLATLHHARYAFS
jgi:uncharacterized protein Usg